MIVSTRYDGKSRMVSLKKEGFDSHGIESFSYIKKNWASEPLLVKIYFDSFN